MLLGFYEANINGHRAIAHGGDTQWFHSDLHLFPDDGVGLYISMNSAARKAPPASIRSDAVPTTSPTATCRARSAERQGRRRPPPSSTRS